jgi:hypothetical protein
MITQTFSLEEVEEAHKLVDDQKVVGRAAIII